MRRLVFCLVIYQWDSCSAFRLLFSVYAYLFMCCIMAKNHNKLEEYLIRHIRTHGPVDVGQFMNIALSHPEYGYYMTRDPFGVSGDFITAPEISQLFGEMIGAWIADVWMQM